jgi:hypothetical protein
VLLDLRTDSIIGRIHHLLVDPDLPKSKVLIRQTVAHTRAGNLLLNRICDTSIEILKEANTAEIHGILRLLVDQLTDRMAQNPPPRGRIVLLANRMLLQKNIVSGGIATNIMIERDEDCAGIIVTCTPITYPKESLSATLSSQVNLQSEIGYGSTSIKLSDKELHVLLLNQRGQHCICIIIYINLYNF